MSPKTTEAVATELKRFAQELKLTDSQKERLRTYLAEVHAKVQDFLQKNPSIAKGALVEKVRTLRGSMVCRQTPRTLPGIEGRGK